LYNAQVREAALTYRRQAEIVIVTYKAGNLD